MQPKLWEWSGKGRRQPARGTPNPWLPLRAEGGLSDVGGQPPCWGKTLSLSLLPALRRACPWLSRFGAEQQVWGWYLVSNQGRARSVPCTCRSQLPGVWAIKGSRQQGASLAGLRAPRLNACKHQELRGGRKWIHFTEEETEAEVGEGIL